MNMQAEFMTAGVFSAGVARKECMVAGEEAFCFAFRTDNTGPPRSAEEVRRGFEVARSQFPGSEVVAGDLDSFYAASCGCDEFREVLGGKTMKNCYRRAR